MHIPVTVIVDGRGGEKYARFGATKRARKEVTKLKGKGKTKKTGRGTLRHYVKAHWQLYLMILPPLIMLLIFSYAPMYGLLMAFKNYRVIDGVWGSP